MEQIGNGEEAIIFTPSSSSSSTLACKLPVPDAFRKREARYVRDDRLRICCTVRVLEVLLRRRAGAAGHHPVATLLESGRGPDVTFAVEASSRFDAHRLVLAMRSPVFRAKFFGDSRDSRQQWFRVRDVGAPVFRAMLRFIYTDELCPRRRRRRPWPMTCWWPRTSTTWRGCGSCEKMLWESVLSVLLRVNGRHSCRQLEDLCVGYVADAWEAATATEEYRELKASCPALLNDILENVVATNHHGRRLGPPPPSSSEKSASTYRSSDVCRGAHEFTIFGYSGVRRTHSIAGDFICSGAFEVGGHEWRILYYPSGYEDARSDRVAALLQLVTGIDPDVTMEVAGTFSIGNHTADGGTATMFDFCHEFMDDILENGSMVELATVDDVKSRYVGRDDSLWVECVFEFGIRVATRTGTATTAAREIVVPPPNISWHLERLITDGGRHGARGIRAVVFKALLHFVYTDELPPLDDLVCATPGSVPSATSWTRFAGDLPAAADRYQLVERMRPMCENLLCEMITPECAAATLELARRHGRPELKAFCLDYMSSPGPGVLGAVVATEGYKDLSGTRSTTWLLLLLLLLRRPWSS
ncbi:BTB/POZ and MATH domain-containing protein 1-like [Panicum miliaceum]|uniref:BTB/POZ and MATH domain-containing protein 1-like n=1 Tax=Panicum miliaceum TaxID=4540 RepID=A0A3L6RAG2_PANMI|nr:BTB/POZ and MATH domain-containing protein 1-like [Panicum miliaceum]